MNLEHNEEVQLTAPLQMWGRNGGVGLRVEESHQMGQNYSESLAEKPFPSSAPAAGVLAELWGSRGGCQAQQC